MLLCVGMLLTMAFAAEDYKVLVGGVWITSDNADDVLGDGSVIYDTADECLQRYGLAGGFSFVVETDGFTSFHSDGQRPAVRPFDIEDYRYGRASHGHMPEKGPQPPMLVSGPAFARHVTLETASILDEAPTFAAALGLSLEQADGRVLKELLAK